MTRQLKRRRERQLKKVRLVPCDFKLTAASGLGTLLEIFDQSGLAGEFAQCLPERVSHHSVGSYMLGLMVMAAHLHGTECLSDFAKLRDDPALEALFGNEVAAARTIGDYLRDFEKEHLDKLNRFLNTMSRTIFGQLKEIQPEPYKPKKLIVDMDSTSHVQHGDGIEGVAWNYKSEWCLDSQVAFNSLGFCHGVQLRAGNTKSGVEAVPLIEQSFRDGLTQAERKRAGQSLFRADSAYCNQDVIKTCLRLGLFFTITAHDGATGWKKSIATEGMAWTPWVWSAEDQEGAKKSGQELRKVEVARYFWQPSWAEGTLLLPIVVKRTWKTLEEIGEDKQGDLFYQDSLKKEGQWVYYAVVTNFDLSTHTLQEVIEHHNLRGNSENFHKEEKYNFKLRKFPCENLKANHAWALFAQVAHNLLRWIALVESPDKPHFSKKLRSRYVFAPGKLVRHARETTLKVLRSFYEEVQNLKKRHGSLPEIVSAQLVSAPGG